MCVNTILVWTIRLFIVVWITGRGMCELPWIAGREHATVWRQIRYQNGEPARSVQNAGWCYERCLGRVAWTLVFTVQGLKLCRQSWLLTESSRILCTYHIYFQMYILTRGYEMRVGSIYFSLVNHVRAIDCEHMIWLTLYVPCRSVCNWDQNWIKWSKPLLGADQGI